MRVHNFKDRWVGEQLLVTGRDSRGAPVRLDNVREIYPRGRRLFARDGANQLHELVA